MLHKFVFVQSYADYSLFSHYAWNSFLCVLIYVDYLLIPENSLVVINKFKDSLSKTFHMKDLRI